MVHENGYTGDMPQVDHYGGCIPLAEIDASTALPDDFDTEEFISSLPDYTLEELTSPIDEAALLAEMEKALEEAAERETKRKNGERI